MARGGGEDRATAVRRYTSPHLRRPRQTHARFAAVERLSAQLTEGSNQHRLALSVHLENYFETL